MSKAKKPSKQVKADTKTTPHDVQHGNEKEPWDDGWNILVYLVLMRSL